MNNSGSLCKFYHTVGALNTLSCLQYQNEIITLDDYEECTDLEKVEEHLKFWNDLLSKILFMLIIQIHFYRLASSTESAVKKTACQVPCTYFSYRKSRLFTNPVKSNISGLAMGFSSMALRVKKESLLYPSSSLFGDIGGSLGLFLGFSLLSFGDSVLVICKWMLKHVVNQIIFYNNFYCCVHSLHLRLGLINPQFTTFNYLLSLFIVKVCVESEGPQGACVMLK